jgi:hypothetical protein
MITTHVAAISTSRTARAAPGQRTLSRVLEATIRVPVSGRRVQLRVGPKAPVWNDVIGPPHTHFHPSGAASPKAMISYEGKPNAWGDHASIKRPRSTRIASRGYSFGCPWRDPSARSVPVVHAAGRSS